jgi:hypothetical protein
MTERHYAHLAPGYVAEVIRATLPRLGLVTVTQGASPTPAGQPPTGS